MEPNCRTWVDSPPVPVNYDVSECAGPRWAWIAGYPSAEKKPPPEDHQAAVCAKDGEHTKLVRRIGGDKPWVGLKPILSMNQSVCEVVLQAGSHQTAS